MWRKSIGYEIQELLGEGSQGQVFKALRRDRKAGLEETVAVKILHSETAVDLWRREFESLRRVRSSYCVQVFAFERIKGRPALVLEFVDGISLAALAQSLLLSADLITEILNQAEAALLELNQCRLSHGDLSPHNILIDKTGRLRLLDFGLANGDGENSRFTPEFAAPERLAGSPPSFPADIFSLGKLEQFLRGRNQPIKPRSKYLHLNPANRKLTGQASCERNREALGRVVEHWLERRALAACLTTRTVIGNTKPPTLSLFMILVAAIFLFTSASSAKSHWNSEDSQLEIRTERWHYFILDGTPVGYSPLSISLKAGRAHRLEWISAGGKGVKVFKAKAQAPLTLQDRDFSH